MSKKYDTRAMPIMQITPLNSVCSFLSKGDVLMSFHFILHCNDHLLPTLSFVFMIASIYSYGKHFIVVWDNLKNIFMVSCKIKFREIMSPEQPHALILQILFVFLTISDKTKCDTSHDLNLYIVYHITQYDKWSYHPSLVLCANCSSWINNFLSLRHHNEKW